MPQDDNPMPSVHVVGVIATGLRRDGTVVIECETADRRDFALIVPVGFVATLRAVADALMAETGAAPVIPDMPDKVPRRKFKVSVGSDPDHRGLVFMTFDLGQQSQRMYAFDDPAAIRVGETLKQEGFKHMPPPKPKLILPGH